MAVGLQAGDLSGDAMAAILAGGWPPDTRVVAFWPAESVFAFLAEALRPARLAEAEQGRLFHPTGELRWRALGAGVRAVHLGEARVPGLEEAAGELAGLAPRRRELLLWGERTDLAEEWIELQVPHVLRYPYVGGRVPRGRLALVVEEWVDGAGRVRLSRYVDLVEREA